MIPAEYDFVIRQPMSPSKKAFAPNSSALTKRAPRSGSIPLKPTSAIIAENPGGKCVIGPFEASQASRYPRPARILRAPAMYAIESSERPSPSGVLYNKSHTAPAAIRTRIRKNAKCALSLNIKINYEKIDFGSLTEDFRSLLLNIAATRYNPVVRDIQGSCGHSLRVRSHIP